MDRYRIHGLAVESALPLPDARPAIGEACDVRVTRDPGVTRCVRDTIALVGYAAHATLFLPEVATFAITAGAQIHITAHVDDEEALRSFLLGSAWAVLLHQRGVLPLHGCTLARDDAAWMCVGESGGGKSTMAAALLRAGMQLVSDDVTAVTTDAAGAWTAPGLRSMKTAATGSVAGEVLGPSFDGAKQRIVPHALAPDRPVRLRGIIELVRASAGTAPQLDRVRGAAGCAIAVRHTFRGVAAPMLGQGAQHLAACAALAGRVPFLRLARPWDVTDVDRTAAWLLERLAAG